MAGQRVAAFAWQLQRQVSEKDECRDAPGFFSSPISLYIAMGLAMAGAGGLQAVLTARILADWDWLCTGPLWSMQLCTFV